MGGERREGYFQMFEILTASVLCNANMRHHSKFCADRSNRYMAVFQFFKMAAVRHLGFLKIGNFNCPYPSGAKMHYSALFFANRSNRCRDMAVFRFFKMAADRHLGFIKNGRHRGSPTWLPREIGI